MDVAEAWRALQAQRFPELPFDCGNSADPGIRFHEEVRDWSDKDTTYDQLRIERFIDRYDLRQKRVLHVGMGNSGLAKRFHRRTCEIVGTTIDEPEIEVARSLRLPNYRFIMHNKYSGKNDAVTGSFDFIVDNNPTSPCCCIRHLSTLFDFYVEKLGPSGLVVTDRAGLEWVPKGANPRWSFCFDDLEAASAVVGLSAYRANETVIVLSRSPPMRPGRAAMFRHRLRRARSLPARIRKTPARAYWRMLRKLIG